LKTKKREAQRLKEEEEEWKKRLAEEKIQEQINQIEQVIEEHKDLEPEKLLEILESKLEDLKVQKHKLFLLLKQILGEEEKKKQQELAEKRRKDDLHLVQQQQQKDSTFLNSETNFSDNQTSSSNHYNSYSYSNSSNPYSNKSNATVSSESINKQPKSLISSRHYENSPNSPPQTVLNSSARNLSSPHSPIPINGNQNLYTQRYSYIQYSGQQMINPYPLGAPLIMPAYYNSQNSITQAQRPMLLHRNQMSPFAQNNLDRRQQYGRGIPRSNIYY